jgi:DNA-binding XRE family transcriptional regulator
MQAALGNQERPLFCLRVRHSDKPRYLKALPHDQPKGRSTRCAALQVFRVTFPQTVVSVWPDDVTWDGDAMARKPALPPEDEKDAGLTAELQVAFGRNVKAARLKANMTQTDLAERCGLRQHHLSQIENGQLNITLGTMARLARTFGEDVPTMLRIPADNAE